LPAKLYRLPGQLDAGVGNLLRKYQAPSVLISIDFVPDSGDLFTLKRERDGEKKLNPHGDIGLELRFCQGN